MIHEGPLLNRITQGNFSDLERLFTSSGITLSCDDLKILGKASFISKDISVQDGYVANALSVTIPQMKLKNQTTILDHTIVPSHCYIENKVRMGFLASVDDFLEHEGWALAETLYVPSRFFGMTNQRVEGILYELPREYACKQTALRN